MMKPHAFIAMPFGTKSGADGQCIDFNRVYAEQWPNITSKKDAPADAKEFETVKGKFEKYFSPEPGEGD